MDSVVASIYAACLSAEAEPHAELVDLVIVAIQDGVAGPDKDKALDAVFEAVEELVTERKQKGALIRIKLTAIATAARSLPQNTRDALLKSMRAMGEVAQEQSLPATSSTIKLLVDSISKLDAAMGQPVPPLAHPESQPAPRAPKPQSDVGMTLKEYLKQHARHAASDKIAFAPDIQLKKISGALTSIGGYVKAEEVVVLIDDTVFGGSKEGVFITNDRIFVKEVFTDLAIYRLDSINHIGADGRKIFVNHSQIVGLAQPDKSDLELLFSAINDYLSVARAQGAPPPSQIPSSTYAPPQSEQEEEELELDDHHGFFYIRAAHICMTQDDQYHERMLLVDLVNASMGLYQFLLSHGVTVSEQMQWVATSDFVHFESLIYVCELTMHLLETKLELSKSSLDDIRRYIFSQLAYEYIEIFTNKATLEEQLMTRAGLYRNLMRNNPTELPKALHSCLTRPSVLRVFDEEQTDVAAAALFHLQAEALSKEMAFAYLRGLSGKVESALLRYGGNAYP